MISKGLKLILSTLFSVGVAFNVAFAQADYANGPETFSLKRAYEQAKLAPDGKHLAVLTRNKGQAGLLIFDIGSMQPVAALSTEDQQDILRFWWANNERVIVNLELRNAVPDYPRLPGELYALNVDNTRKFAVAGFSAGDTANYEYLGPNSKNDKEIRVIRSDIRNRRNVDLDLSRPVAYNLDVYKRFRQSTGTNMKSKRLEDPQSSPYETGGFVTDNTSELRLAFYIDEDGFLKFSEKVGNSKEWTEFDFSAPMLDEQRKSNPIVGFDADNSGVYFLGKSQFDNVGLFHVELATGQVRTLYEHEQSDIRKKDLIMTSDHDVVGVNVAGTATAQFFNTTHPETGRLRGLVNAFQGKRVEILNYSNKGEFMLVDVISEGTESGLYLFQGSNNSVSMLLPANS